MQSFLAEKSSDWFRRRWFHTSSYQSCVLSFLFMLWRKYRNVENATGSSFWGGGGGGGGINKNKVKENQQIQERSELHIHSNPALTDQSSSSFSAGVFTIRTPIITSNAIDIDLISNFHFFCLCTRSSDIREKKSEQKKKMKKMKMKTTRKMTKEPCL